MPPAAVKICNLAIFLKGSKILPGASDMSVLRIQVVSIDGVIAAVAQEMVEDIRARDAAEAAKAVDLAASLRDAVRR